MSSLKEIPNKGQVKRNGSNGSILEAVGTTVNASQLTDVKTSKYLSKKLVQTEAQRLNYLSRLTKENQNTTAKSLKKIGANQILKDRYPSGYGRKLGFESPDQARDSDFSPGLEDQIIKIKIVDDAEKVV